MTSPSSPHGDRITLAVVTILFTVLALSFGDAVIKEISTGFVLWQIFVLRSALAIPVLVTAVKVRDRTTGLLPRHAGWTVLRSLLLVTMWVAYYAALPHLDLSIAAAAYYTIPMFIALFSALLIHERVGKLGWIAVVLGFAGVLLILRPSAEDFNAWALLPLVSAVCYALAMILTRTRCRDENPAVLSLALNVAFVVVGAGASGMILLTGATDEASFLLGPWTAMEGREWMTMVVLAAAVIIGSVGAALAYQVGPPAIVATFDFAYVGFAAIWGFVFFTEVPDAVTLAGMVLIVVAGLLVTRRSDR